MIQKTQSTGLKKLNMIHQLMKYSSSASTQRMELIKINIESITKNKISSTQNVLADLNSLLEEQGEKLSKEANAYLRDEIARCESNINYYKAILKILESEEK